MIHQQVALVTGSGKRRVGRYVAEFLAERGYAIVLHYRSSAADAAEALAEFQSRGIRAVALQADLTDEIAVRGMMQSIVEQFGRLDVLVNCASVWQAKRFEDVTDADVR